MILYYKMSTSEPAVESVLEEEPPVLEEEEKRKYQNVKQLNKVFLEFCDDLKKVVPANEHEKINTVANRINEKMTTKYYLDYFVRHSVIHVSSIADCDEAKCVEADFMVLSGFSFKKLFSYLDEKSKQTTWKYLHTFYILAHPNITLVLAKHSGHEHYEQIKVAGENHVENLEKILKSSGKYMEENMKGSAKDMEDMFLNSAIGDLAREISGEIDASELGDMENPQGLLASLMSGNIDETKGIGKIVSTVGEKLTSKLQNGQLDETKMFQEAQQMMGMMNMFSGGKGMSGMSGGMPDMSAMMNMMMGMDSSTKSKKKKNKKIVRNKHP